jgi:hypothetical protein
LHATAGLIWLKLRPGVGFHGLVNRLSGLLSGSSNTNFNRGLGLAGVNTEEVLYSYYKYKI